MFYKILRFVSGFFKKEPELYLESRTVETKEGSRLIAQGEGWEYAGYGIGDSMNIARIVDENGIPTGGKVFIT